MDAELDNDLFGRLSEADLPAEVIRLVEASWSGDVALDEALGEGAIQATAQPRTSRPMSPAAVFLSSIEVRGFRGIAQSSKLAVEPGPGLTLVVGRNGSGKSSFAEAAELAMTGTFKRWDGKAAQWRAGWRNLHAKHSSFVRCAFLVEGVGETTCDVGVGKTAQSWTRWRAAWSRAGRPWLGMLWGGMGLCRRIDRSSATRS